MGVVLSPRFIGKKVNYEGVDLWFLDAPDAGETVEKWKECLSADELKRASQYRFAEDRNRFVVRRRLLRRILSAYVDKAPEKIVFQYTGFKRPFLADAQIQFSLSSSQGASLLAVDAQGRDVGVDIEHTERGLDFAEIIEQAFSAREKKEFLILPDTQKREAFFNGWTRKEAFVKALGQGLSYPMRDFDVSLKPGEPPKILDIRNSCEKTSDWNLMEVDVGANYKASLVVKGGGRNADPLRFSTEDAVTL